MAKTFDFKTQLRVGDEGERWLLENYHEPLTPFEGRAYDFVDQHGRPLELKTESRSLEDTPNFFIERWSDMDAQKPGGPWQSIEKGVQVLVYLFYPSQTYFVFDSLPLVIKNIEDRKLTPKVIFNRGYRAAGYVVKRDTLAHLCVRHEHPSTSK